MITIEKKQVIWILHSMTIGTNKFTGLTALLILSKKMIHIPITKFDGPLNP